jgi:hypothetical protein
MVIKSPGGGDSLFLLRKVADHFEAIHSMPCAFVQLSGKYHLDDLDPVILEAAPEWAELKNQEVSKTRFWWSGRGNGTFVWRTLGIRSFLSIVEPHYQPFKIEIDDEVIPEEYYFGIWDKPNQSLVIAKDDWLITYGSSVAREKLMRHIQHWVELGMPTTACFDLKVYPVEAPLPKKAAQWNTKRQESQFLWSPQRD